MLLHSIVLACLWSIVIAQTLYKHPIFSDGSCPMGYHIRGRFCWSQDMDAWLVFQNKLQEDYMSDPHDLRQMVQVDTHRMVITAFARALDQPKNSAKTPLKDTIISIQLLSKSPSHIVLVPTQRGIESRVLRTRQTYQFRTNDIGKVILAIPLNSLANQNQNAGRVNVDKLHSTTEPPLVRARAEFMPRGEWFVVPMDIDAVQSMSVLTGAKLASSPHIGPRKTQKQIDDAAAAIRSLSKSALNARMRESSRILPGDAPSWASSNAAKKAQKFAQPDPSKQRIHRRDLPSKKIATQPYDHESNVINHLFIHKTNELHSRDADGSLHDHVEIDRVLDISSMDFKHMELDFRNSNFRLTHHSPESMDDRIRKHTGKPRLLQRRGFFRDLRRGFRSIGKGIRNGFKTFGKSVKKVGKTIGKTIKNTGKQFGRMVKNMVKDPRNMWKHFVNGLSAMTQTVVKGIGTVAEIVVQTPVDIMKAVAKADLVLFRPLNDFANGLETYVVNPIKGVLRFVVHTVSGLIGVIAGILANLEMLPKFLFELLKALFNWGAILRTAQFLNHHFEIMAPFARMMVNRQAVKMYSGFDGVASLVTTGASSLPKQMVAMGVSPDAPLSRLTKPQTDNSRLKFVTNNPAADTDVVAFDSDGRTTSHKLSFSHDTEDKHTGIQATWLRDMAPSVTKDVQNTEVRPSDKGFITQIVEIIRSTIEQSRLQTRAMGKAFSDAWNQLKGKLANGLSIKFKDIMLFLKQIFDVALRGVIQLAVILVVKVSEVLIQFFHSIMSYHINIPIISWIYETLIMRGTQKLTFYSLISLAAAIPVTILGQAHSKTWKTEFQEGEFFSEDDKNILLSVRDPSKYMEAWMPEGYIGTVVELEPLLERKRNVLSYILGAASSETRFFSSLLGALDIIDKLGVTYIVRAPFQYIHVMTTYPHDWYFLGLDPKEKVKIFPGTRPIDIDTIRFVPWFLKLAPLALGFAPMGMFRAGICVLLNLASIVLTFIRDINLNNIGKVKSFQYMLDILLKAFSNIASALGDLARSVPEVFTSIAGEVLDVAGAAGHILRLGIDMMGNAMYSV